MTLGKKGVISLPFEHNHLLQAAIYNQIEQLALKLFLHERGFRLGKRSFKLFTFSRLRGAFRLNPQEKTIIFTPPVNFIFCSPFELLVQEVGNGFLKQGQIRLGEEILAISRIKLSDPVVRDSALSVEMLSPLVIYSTMPTEGKSFTHYYSPFEPRFAELVFRNLSKKYQIVHGQPPERGEFLIEPKNLNSKGEKVIIFKGTIIKGWMGTFHLQGPPQLLELALHAGLGSKNSEGFGCCAIKEGG